MYWEDLPSLGFESLIDEKSARNNLLSEVSKALNRVQSAVRASVDYVFRCMSMVNGWNDDQKNWASENRCVVWAQKSHLQLSPISAAHFQPRWSCIALNP